MTSQQPRTCIAWSFRFPSMGALQNLGTNNRKRKRDDLSISVNCKDMRPNRHTVHLQSDVVKSELIITPPYNENEFKFNDRITGAENKEEEEEKDQKVKEQEKKEGHDACLFRSRPLPKRPEENNNSKMDQSEETLRKLLERELRLLDPRDLRSHAWYHGSTLRGGRKGAEAEVPNEGDFLVRDCASQPGNYVLTVRCKGQALHFVINKVVLQPETVYERAQYQFEDEAFDTVADLITFYVGSGRPISQASGARIINPRPRSAPITCVPQGNHCSSPSSSSSLSTSSPPRLPRKQQRSHSLTPQQHTLDHSKLPNTKNSSIQSSTLPRIPQIQNQSPSCSLSLGRQKITRVISDPIIQHPQQSFLQQQSNSQQHQLNHHQLPASSIQQQSNQNHLQLANQKIPTPPPKPPRIPYTPNHLNHLNHHHHNLHHHHHHHGYQASGSDSGNGSGDSEFENNSGSQTSSAPIKGVVIRSHYNVNEGANGNTSEYELSTEEQLVVAAPTLEIATALDLEGFTTLLLPAGEHRPLDPTALRGVSGMLHDSAPRVLASHLTRIDLEIALNAGMGSRGGLSGLELATLPHGRQARLDLIERSECMKLLVAVTVLAGANAIERATTISKWIKVAIDTKTALGNLYGFCSIMLGLCLPQIQKLANTWHLLRQKYTDEAFSFEAKLRPTLRAMNECNNPQAPNTTLPHLLPIALLGERGLEDILGTVSPSGLAAAILSPWEHSASDCGLSIVWAHLEASRKLTENLPLFRRNAEIALDGCRSDELLADAFRTEFHIKFLWGSRGATVGPEERYLKFSQVLDAMFEKCAASEISA
ncbi:breast cancer anti-estrogen resistance protein 3 homolog isoform X2 [Leptopilina boulardi]|uniref:breast cancer anti-estrogen resistance protein 3 homolog isoform X2 n=1 Tax=Leptopilina boulardi TaxID=63433 RepID=UPI0021F60822|nr:breast cancer anti-estrogen resistance protein 3 homolog isoform X2 [Leptopilina boulardi]